MDTKFRALFTLILFFTVWLCLMGVPKDTKEISTFGIIFLIVAGFAFALKIWPAKYSGRIRPLKATLYFIWLIKEIFKSSIVVIKLIWQNKPINQALEIIESVQNNELGMVIYANSITLTPGTITLDLGNGKLLVHALDKSSIEDLKQGEMDKRVKEILC